MIQRIQSLFLLLAAGAALGLLAFPFADTGDAVAASALFNDTAYNIQDNIAMVILFCLAGALVFVSIFLFKNRKLQKQLSRVAIVANIIGLVLAIILYMQDTPNLGDAEPNDNVGLFLPVVFLVFALLAIRFINKDDQVVKSMDRLR